tara:strand:- start:482 stop:793 length:312 start_codon:yes stop_codon:yes gene_type:complete
MNEISVVVVFTGLLLIIISKVINKENAKILLSGYNTMSESKREKFDIDGYLKFFKPFFYKWGTYSMLIYFATFLFTDQNTASIVYAISLTIPVPYLIIKGKRF